MSSPTVPSPPVGDASFGLDPSADVQHHLEGHRWLPELDWHVPLHLSARSARTSSRRASRSGSRRSTSRAKPAAAAALAHSEEHSTSDDGDEEAAPAAGTMRTRPPTGSLSFSIFSSGVSWTRRLSLFASSITVNAALPFVNGVMLGTGEIVARALIVPVIFIGWNWLRQKTAD